MAKQRSFVNAVKWAYTGTWGERGISSLVAVVVAAILGPDVFGMVSVAIVYVAILQAFLDQGLLAALVQKKELDDDHLNSVFWTNQALGVVLLAAGLLLARWWAAENHAPAAASFISALSFDIPIMALSIAHFAILKRELNFKTISIISNISAASGGLVGIGMAVAGLGAWSLIGLQLTKDGVSTVLAWRTGAWRPKQRFSWRHLRELLDFSIAHFFAQLGILSGSQATSVALGIFFGPLALGLYRIAERFMNSVVAMSTSAVQMVAFSQFSRHQDDREAIRSSAITCLRITADITLPALAGLAAVSTPLMAMLGARWLPAAPVLKILCALGVAIVFSYFTGPLLQALSRPRQGAILEWGAAVVAVAALFLVAWSVRHGSTELQIIAVAAARLAAFAILVTPFFLVILMRICGISMRELARAIAPAALSAASVIAAVSGLARSEWLSSGPVVVLLGAEVAVGGALGIAVLLTVETQMRRSVFNALGLTVYQSSGAK